MRHIILKTYSGRNGRGELYNVLARKDVSAQRMVRSRVGLRGEPTEGLAPILVEELLGALLRILREEAMAAIVVEQRARKVLKITGRAIIIDRGSAVHEAPSSKLRGDSVTLERYLGLANGATPAGAQISTI